MNDSTRPRFAAGTAGAASTPPRRRGVRLLVWVVAIVVGVALAAWGALALFFPPAKLHALAAAKLSSMLARDVRFKGASLWLWPPVRLSVSQPAFAESGGFAHGTALEAQAIHLDLDALRLLGRRIVVRRLVLDQPAVHLELNPDGTTNFDGIMKSPGEQAQDRRSSTMELAVSELSIVDGHVLLDDLRTRRRATFRVNSKVALRAEAGGTRFATSGETRIADLASGPLSAARMADLDRSLAKLEWRIEHDGKYDQERKRLALTKLALHLGKTQLAMTGVVDDPGPRARLDLMARGEGVDLGSVMGFLAAADAQAVHGVSASGRMNFDLHIHGALGPGRHPDATGTLRVTNGSFRYPGAPAAIDNVTFGARLAPDSLAIGDLRARVAGQPVQAALYASHLEDPRVRFAVKGNLDLAAVAPLVAPQNTKLAGRAAVDVRGSGRAKDPGSLALDGDATLTGVSVESPKLPNRIDDIAGVIQFSPSHASVSGLSARAGKSSFKLEATVARPLALLSPIKEGPDRIEPAQVDFSLTSPHLDLAELLPPVPGAPVVPNATGGGRVQISWLRSNKLVAEDVAARIGLEPGILNVPDFSARAYGGTATGRARFDLREPARPVFDVTARVDSLEADDLLSAWTPVKGFIHGALATTFSLSGAGLSAAEIRRTVTAKGLAAVANGVIGPSPVLDALARVTRSGMQQLHFKNGHVPFRVDHGRVMTDSVSFQGPNGLWRASGSAGFDGSLDYAVSGLLPAGVAGGADLRNILAAGALTDPQGRVLLDLRITGNARSPKVEWDPRAMQDRLAGRVSQALEDQRAKLEQELRAILEGKRREAQDSTRKVEEVTQKSVADSLRNTALDLLKGFFPKSKQDTTKKQ